MRAAVEVVAISRDGRPLPTELHVPAGPQPWPLVLFAHGWMGHPDRFTRLFGRWTGAGFAVAAPTFPFTNASSSGQELEDVANQPADVRAVLDRLLEDRRLDSARVAVAGFSLGGMTALGTVFGRPPELRADAVVAISARLPGFTELEPRPVPLLVVHGRHDDVVAYEHGVEAYERAAAPKALLTIELPGHEHYVQDEHSTDADSVVADVAAAFLDRTLNGSDAPRPVVDSRLGRLASEGLW